MLTCVNLVVNLVINMQEVTLVMLLYATTQIGEKFLPGLLNSLLFAGNHFGGLKCLHHQPIILSPCFFALAKKIIFTN